MVRITSLPLGLDVNEVMAGLSDDVSRDTGLDKNLMTYYWQTFDAVYCPALKDAVVQHPIFVDMYVPGFLTDEVIAGLMISLASFSTEAHRLSPRNSCSSIPMCPRKAISTSRGASRSGTSSSPAVRRSHLPRNRWRRAPVERD